MPQASFVCGDLVEDLGVVAREHGPAIDHHVDLVGAQLHRAPHVRELHLSGDCPLGNAVATLATFTVEPASACLATGTRFG